MGRASLAAFTLAVFMLFGNVRSAHAAPPTTSGAAPLYVLSLATDDADDQADALTTALRTAVRASSSFTLLEAGQSFETLAIALRCPEHPDAACLSRVGDQLHASHYLWGSVNRHAGRLEAELHLWNRGKPSAETTAVVPDGAKDANDPALRTLATHALDELAGVRPNGTLIVRAGNEGGAVIVDGAERGTLLEGSARLSLPSGEHTVSVRSAGVRGENRTTIVPPGGETTLQFATLPVAGLTPVSNGEPPSTQKGGLRLRGILGYSAIVAGAGLMVAAGFEAAAWSDDKNASSAKRANVPSTVTNVCNDSSSVPAQEACQKIKDGQNAAVLGWAFGALGAVLAGTGTWMVLSDTAPERSPHDGSVRMRERLRVELIPRITTTAQSLDVRLRF
jgi:hypothetical protein